ncbi:uncharacterized protein LOC101861680 [Aplysia californica]|uniref:Uncharacterized protein LOC101861680 n=1 Tax=Aplysia californica TaxID=6500 RepID=A0ABM1A6M4_APLCA|nr:uncharacterized protein LOC101861680 [Aplysia californica]
MSETHPVRFEKLINGETRPRLAQPRPEGYKIKHRAVHTPKDRRSASAKVKVVYIDPLSREEEEKVNRMSVDEIVNFQVGGMSREGTAASIHRAFQESESAGGIITVNEETDGSLRPSRVTSSKASRHHNSRPSSNYSQHSEKSGSVSGPKLKTLPVHPSANQQAADLGIISYGARNHPPVNEMPRAAAKTPGKISPVKPLHRAGAGQGSSIKAGPMPGETEFIKITSQLKVANPSGGIPTPPGQAGAPAGSFPHYQFSPGSNTPRDPDYQSDVYQVDNVSEGRDLAEFDNNNPKFSSRNVTPTLHKDGNISNRSNNNNASNSARNNLSAEKADGERDEAGQEERREEEKELLAGSVTSESPGPTAVAISIPTADELSDSPGHSPVRRPDDGLTQKQRRERDMTNEQIDQLTHLIGDAIVES